VTANSVPDSQYLLHAGSERVGALDIRASINNGPMPEQPIAVPTVTYPTVFADPVRGAKLLTEAPAGSTFVCADCHSENPLKNNFWKYMGGAQQHIHDPARCRLC